MTYTTNNRVLTREQVLEWIRTHREEIPTVVKRKRKSDNIRYYNIAAAFDIETSSFYDAGEKRAIMYHWQFGIYDCVCFGRTYGELLEFLDALTEALDLNDLNRLVIYVHNLAYEFQFIRRWFDWTNVFALKDRKVCYAVTGGIEFRCSYILTNKGLESVSEDLNRYKIKKLSGDLDYSLIRHSGTSLTEAEKAYCENDIRVITAYITEQLENGEDIAHIPLTATGYVRRFCREQTLKSTKANNHAGAKYRGIINRLKVTPEEYKLLKRAFQGGFTHASFMHSGETCHDVTSYDFTSSYPAQMIAQLYPMSQGSKIEIKTREQFEYYTRNYLCVFDIELTSLKARPEYTDDYISASKCYIKENVTENNGRVHKADRIATTITNIDLQIINKLYTYKSRKVANFYIYRPALLPKAFVEAILTLYEDKTRLKGVSNAAIEYAVKKAMLNASFGMTVTDIIRDIIEYAGEWTTEAADPLEQIDKYNNDKSRFLFYPWGVFITAYVRRALWSAIIELKGDYIYSDTDSVKIINAEKHKEYFERYNADIIARIKTNLKALGLDPERATPSTVKGAKKPLGVWDYDGFYTAFKTLGAKRYMIHTHEQRHIKDIPVTICKTNITVSGINKREFIPWIQREYGHNANYFDLFTKSLTVPADGTGKQTHTYIDTEASGSVTDYLGNTADYCEKSFIHLEGAEYNFSISGDYAKFLEGYVDFIM